MFDTGRGADRARRAAPDVLSAGVTDHDPRADLPRERHTVGVLVAVPAHHRYVQVRRVRRHVGADGARVVDARGLGLRLILHEYIPVLGWGTEVASQV